jgi:hypothetical protein
MARSWLVVILLLLDCTGRGGDRVRLEPRTGHQQSPGENRTQDWTSAVQCVLTIQQRCAPLSCTAPHWAMLHLLSYAAPHELRCTLCTHGPGALRSANRDGFCTYTSLPMLFLMGKHGGGGQKRCKKLNHVKYRGSTFTWEYDRITRLDLPTGGMVD